MTCQAEENKTSSLDRFKSWAQVVLWSLMIATALWGATAAFAAMMNQIERNKTVIADHEQRLRQNEQTLSQIATDLRWIRKSIETERSYSRR
jgi:type II secretory pathway component PulJ